MGNCAYKVLGIGSLSGEDHDEAWKRQTRGRLENKLYTFVDLKGLESNTEFVKIWKESGKTGFVRKLQDEKILQPYLYEHGDGKVLTAEEVKQWQNEMEPEVNELLACQPSTQAFPSRLLDLGFGAKFHDVTE